MSRRCCSSAADASTASQSIEPPSATDSIRGPTEFRLPFTIHLSYQTVRRAMRPTNTNKNTVRTSHGPRHHAQRPSLDLRVYRDRRAGRGRGTGVSHNGPKRHCSARRPVMIPRSATGMNGQPATALPVICRQSTHLWPPLTYNVSKRPNRTKLSAGAVSVSRALELPASASSPGFVTVTGSV